MIQPPYKILTGARAGDRRISDYIFDSFTEPFAYGGVTIASLGLFYPETPLEAVAEEYERDPGAYSAHSRYVNLFKPVHEEFTAWLVGRGTDVSIVQVRPPFAADALRSVSRADTSVQWHHDALGDLPSQGYTHILAWSNQIGTHVRSMDTYYQAQPYEVVMFDNNRCEHRAPFDHFTDAVPGDHDFYFRADRPKFKNRWFARAAVNPRRTPYERQIA